MRFLFIAALLLAALPSLAQTPQLTLEELRLWDGPAPNAKGDAQKDIPTLTVHRPDPALANGAAVIIAPGGGYFIHAIDHEGLHVANVLTSRGITCFMLTYRLRRDEYQPDDAWLDGNRAVRYLRHHGADFSIDSNRIGVLGFSAGGHLASALAVDFTEGDPASPDPIERHSSRPDFVVLCYAVTSNSGDRLNTAFGRKPVTDRTPPTFIFHTTQDMIDPAGVINFYTDLRKNNVDAELHIYGGYGPHGTGLGSGDPAISTWPDLALRWMRKTGKLSAAPRVPLTGKVTIGGKPMLRGWITLTPLDNDSAPVAAFYIHDDRDNPGSYTFTPATGPNPGRHTVTITHVGNEILPRPTLAEELAYQPENAAGNPLVVDVKTSDTSLDIDIVAP